MSGRLVLATLAVLALTGCSGEVSIGERAVESDELAKQVTTQLTKTVGRAPGQVTCPDDLDAQVGAETRCELTDADTTYGVTVTVTEIKGDTIVFDLKVDDEPTP